MGVSSRMISRLRTRTEWKGLAILPLLLLALGGCNPYQTALIAGVNAISYLETDKTVEDHVLSKMTHEDCSTERIFKDGHMCRDTDTGTTVAQAQPVYCYRTLGAITCYDKPDPYESGSNLVQSPRAPEVAETAAGRDQ